MSRSEPRLILAAACGMITLTALACFTLVIASVEGVTLTRPLALSLLLLSASAGCGVAWLVTKLIAPGTAAFPTASVSSESSTSLTTSLVNWFGPFALLLGLALLLAGAWGSLHAAELDVDGGSYHLPAIHAYLQAGRIVWVDDNYPFSAWINGYPKGTESLSYLLCVATGNTRFDRFGNLFFILSGALSVGALTSWWGCRRSTVCLTTGLYLTVPVNVVQYYCIKNDSAAAGAIVASACLLVITASGLGRLRWPATLILSLTFAQALSLAMIAKTTGLAAMFVFGVAYTLVLAWWAIGGSDETRRARAIAKALMLFVAVLSTTLVMGSYWYLRNYQHTGSPLYPAGLKIAGRQVFPGPEAISIIGHMVPEHYKPFPWVVRVALTWTQIGGPPPGVWYPASISPSAPVNGGLGWVWLLGGLPATCLAMLFFRLRWQAVLLVIPTALLFLIVPMNFTSRYTGFLPGVGLPLLALALEGRSLPRPRRAPPLWWFGPFALLVTLEALLMGVILYRNCFREIDRRLDLQLSGYRHLRENPGDVAVAAVWEPVSQRVGLSTMNPPQIGRRVTPVGVIANVTPELLDSLEKRGYKHLVLDFKTPIPDEAARGSWSLINLPETKGYLLTLSPVSPPPASGPATKPSKPLEQ